VFGFRDDAISPHGPRLESLRRDLPRAHHAAHHEATQHLHRKVSEVAEGNGLPTDPIRVFKGQTGLYVGIGFSPEGDRLANLEFGLPNDAPRPVFRQAAHNALPEARSVYSSALRQMLGLI
jgi:hypothetical protein